MNTTTLTLETQPPVNVKIWNKNNKFYWKYDYEGCPKYGAFNTLQQAQHDAIKYSNK